MVRFVCIWWQPGAPDVHMVYCEYLRQQQVFSGLLADNDWRTIWAVIIWRDTEIIFGGQFNASHGQKRNGLRKQVVGN